MIVSEIKTCLIDDDGKAPSITVTCDVNGVQILIKDMVDGNVAAIYVDYDSMLDFIENAMHIVTLGKKKYDGKGHPVV